MSGCDIAIIADDLTGALDAAAPFAMRGVNTKVVVSLERLPDALEHWKADLPALISVNTESRHLSAQQAAARVEQVLALLAPLEPTLWFKKVDSTLRGQPVAESLAARASLGRRLLIAPAVPSQGRTVHDAQIRVHGVPLGASDFASDARSPSPSATLDTLFSVTGEPLLCLGANPALPSQDAVADTVMESDLKHLAEQLWRAPEDWLPVGAAGLTTALAQCAFGEPTSPVRLGAFSGLWMSIGSRSQQAQRQIEQFRKAVPALPVSNVLLGEFPSSANLDALLVPGDSQGKAFSAEDVATHLANAFIDGFCTEGENHRLGLLSGGDIAMALFNRLDIAVIEVAGEWVPGIVTCHPEGREEMSLMTKAGGFGSEDLLVQLWTELHRNEISCN